MDDNMVSDESIKVLSERIGGISNLLITLQQGVQKTNDRLDSFQALQISAATQGVQIANLEAKSIAHQHTMDDLFRLLEPIREEVSGNKKARWIFGTISVLIPAILGGVYSQWHPWMEDIQKAKNERNASLEVYEASKAEELKRYQFDIGQELRKDDNRLTLAEFRLNNLDDRKSK